MKLVRKTHKTIDFIIGFVGWFVIYSLFWLPLCVLSSLMGETGMILMPCACFLPLPIAIIALVLLIYTGHWRIALGALSAFAVNSTAMILVNPLEADDLLGRFLFIIIFWGLPFFADNLLSWLGFQCF